jgi:hypothetical protein
MNGQYAWLFQLATTIAVGAVAYFLKELKKSIDVRFEKNETEIAQVKRELNDLKSDLPFIYTTREDFIRFTNNIEKKLDKIYEFITRRGT